MSAGAGSAKTISTVQRGENVTASSGGIREDVGLSVTETEFATDMRLPSTIQARPESEPMNSVSKARFLSRVQNGSG